MTPIIVAQIAGLGSLVALLVALAKPFLPAQVGNASRPDVLHALSALVGAALALAYVLAASHSVNALVIEETLAAGLTVGAGTTAGYAGAQLGVAKVKTFRLTRVRAAAAAQSA